MISVIIPTYGQEKLVKTCISYLKDFCNLEKEIIVIDDGFGIDIEDDSITFIKHKSNYGFSCSVNAGIKRAKYDKIVLCNSDVFIHPGCIEKLVFALENYADIVGAKLLYPDGTIQHAGIVYMGNKNFFHYKTEQPSQFVPVTGALIAFKKEVIEKIGGFDERYFVAFEDVDFCFRAIKAGLKVLYYNEAVAIHLEGATRGRTYKEKMEVNPEAFKKEIKGKNFFDTKYKDEEIIKLCKPTPLAV